MRLPIQFVAALALPLGVFAQTVTMPPRVVRASGDATVKAKPDHAQIRISVVSEALTAQGAAQANAKQTTQVIDALKSNVGDTGELKTTDYAISPQYQYGNNTPPKLTGYRANNTVLVESNDIGSVGTLIDASVKAGANNIDGISFTLKNDQTVRIQAIAQATQTARSNAEAIAKALGVKAVAVVNAETTGSDVSPPTPRPMMMARMQSAAAPPTPVETGTLEIHANVTVTLLIQD